MTKHMWNMHEFVELKTEGERSRRILNEGEQHC